jgi:histidinol-phosphatase (PHP family)
MPLACIHTHTVFCDGSDDIETCCLAAYRKGLASIGFSAHAPITSKTGFSSSWNLPEEKLPQYLDEVRAAQKRWEGKLPVYLGLEVDFIDGLMGPADRDFREMGLDYIIGSVHFLIPSKGEPFTVDDSAGIVDAGIKESFGGDPLGMVDMYYDSVAAMIRAGGFDVLGHPDLIKKNNAGNNGFRRNRLFSEETESYRKKTAVLAGLMADTGVPAEINTGGINRGKIKDCYPSLPLLKLFREQGVPMVINADAHKADDLDGNYDEARKSLLAAGYTGSVIFEGRKNGRAIWRSEKL